MTIRGIWNLIRFHWMVILLALLLGAACGAGLANASQTEYTAKAEVFVGVNNGQDASEIAQGADYSQRQARNFAAVATRQLVLQDVVDDLGLDMTVGQLRQKIATTVPLNTSIISIAATDNTPQEAAQLANGVAGSLSDSVGRLAPQLNNGVTPVRLQSVERAEPPQSPSAPAVKLMITLGALLGFSLALLLLGLNDFFRAKVRSPEQARLLTGAPVIGTITRRRDLHKRPMVLRAAPNSLRAEQYRQIRTNLRFLQMDQGHKIFLITSAVPGEAKSTTAANIAATMASDGTSVCLVEADLRKPTLAGILDLEGGVGFTTVMAGEAELADVLQTWGDDGLQVLLSGESPPNPSELLGSKRAEMIINSIRDHFDVTIVDCPPLNPVTDATILARLYGGALMVVSERNVEVRDLRRAVDRMSTIEAPILGTIVTMSRESTSGEDYYTTNSPDVPAKSARKKGRGVRAPVGIDSRAAGRARRS